MNLKSDIEQCSKAITKELESYVRSLKYVAREEDRWYQASIWLNLEKEKLYERRGDRNAHGVAIVYYKRFTEHLINAFQDWIEVVPSSFWGDFFIEKEGQGGFQTLEEIRQQHLRKFNQIGNNRGEYEDSDQLQNPNIDYLHPIVVRGAALIGLRRALDNYDQLKYTVEEFCANPFRKKDPYVSIRNVENRFNQLSVDAMINHIDLLNHTSKKLPEPILSQEDSVKLVEAIVSLRRCDPLLNIKNVHAALVRRHFYDLYIISDDVRSKVKGEYIRVLENFSVFNGKVDQTFIENTNASKQTTSLKEKIGL
ncbi:MAG: hypothetical protein JXQ90_21100 [Cyclobacteriaceae bacterium]